MIVGVGEYGLIIHSAPSVSSGVVALAWTRISDISFCSPAAPAIRGL